MTDSALSNHVERFLTYVTRHERIVSDRMSAISGLYDTLIENFECLYDCSALTEIQDSARKLLELEAQEAEVIESMASSNLTLVRDSNEL